MKQQGDEEPDELFVKSEKDQSTLLVSKVLEHKEYQKQQGNWAAALCLMAILGLNGTIRHVDCLEWG